MQYQVHTCRWDQLDGLVEASYARFGEIDLLVNNGGVSPLHDSLSSVTETVRLVVSLNPEGPLRVSGQIGKRITADGKAGAFLPMSARAGTWPAARSAT